SPIPGSDLVVQNSSGSALLTIDSVGTATFSGQLNANQLTANRLSFGLVQPALAISNTELLATGSAGVATISAHQTEVTIQNSLVTDKSLIYITPIGNPNNLTPFLMRQVANESFTAGIQSPSDSGVPFNWLIIN
ncbi:MAG: hypothetical protein Q7R31_01805, partial [Candidatus Levybacteria bacterium]|nr:hypothetical protein [Candidatus Levybacteria bacterium]